MKKTPNPSSALAGASWRQTNREKNVPPAFLDFVAQQWALNQRDKFRAVYGRIMLRLDQWRAGNAEAALPGYRTPPSPGPKSVDGTPAGWTEGNLHKAAKKRASSPTRTVSPKNRKSEIGNRKS